MKQQENIVLAAEKSTENGKKRKRLVKDELMEFERILDEKLRNDFLKKNVTLQKVQKIAKEILETNPEYRAVMGKIRFGEDYCYGFLKRAGWVWNLLKGAKRFFPKAQLDAEVQRKRCNIIFEHF